MNLGLKHLLATLLVGVSLILSGCSAQPAPGVPRINIVSAPSSAAAGVNVAIIWEVTGVTDVIPHTAVHYDTIASHPGDLGNATPAQSGYPALTPDFSSGNFTIPRTFTVNITAPPTAGKIYYRAHTIVGGTNYWTDEREILVRAPKTEIRFGGTPTPGTAGIIEALVTAAPGGTIRDETVSGVIKIEALTVPSSPPTTAVAFVILEDGKEFRPENIVPERFVSDTSGADGWSTVFDTAKMPNGVYTLIAVSSYAGAPDQSPWSGFAMTKIIVRN